MNNFKNGDFIKTQSSLTGERANETWKPGIIVERYETFALIQFKKFKKCLSYNEFIKIKEKEYTMLKNK